VKVPKRKKIEMHRENFLRLEKNRLTDRKIKLGLKISLGILYLIARFDFQFFLAKRIENQFKTRSPDFKFFFKFLEYKIFFLIFNIYFVVIK